MVGGAAIAVARATAMEPVASGQIEEAELGDEVAALAHFRVDAPEYIPVDGIEGVGIPFIAPGEIWGDDGLAGCIQKGIVNLACDAFRACGDVGITKRVGIDNRVERTGLQLSTYQVVAYDVKDSPQTAPISWVHI